MSSEKKFGFIRSLLWPVHRSELKKVLSMLVLLFLLCICYSVLRNLKDTIVLTAKNSGAEVIPFLKVWGMLPGAIVATWIYTRLFRFFTRETVFYIVISSFICYFILFAFVIHPNSDKLHLDRLGDWLTVHLPVGFKGLIAMIRNWSFTTFYIISELWSVVVLAVLFWGFANDITEVSEAKRTYGILNIGSNMAPILGGGMGIICSKFLPLSAAADSQEAWSNTLTNIVLMLSVLGVCSMIVFYWINRNIVPKDKVSSTGYSPKRKFKLSIRDSIRYIYKSRYLTCLAIIVLGYNISINITDILWKEQLKRYFTDPNDMMNHMNAITVGIGIAGTMGGMFFSMAVNRLGWTFTAILTPAIMTIMAVGFFIFLFCGDGLTAFAMTMFGATPFAMTVYFGSLQNCLSKAGKYSLFDASKEIAFLPLEQDAKIKGKAAIDGLGSGIGKSGSSLTYQGLIISLGSVALSTPYIAVILFVVLVAWISSVVTVGGLFKKTSAAATTATNEPVQV
ncbi:MAG: NTP/NDP exchange transporter [Chlamydiae bacterium]|nr:NTP/NDP exchange transporter [Chlamydiota bacterium]